MNKSKVISTISYLINLGISSDRYHSPSTYLSKSKLDKAKAFWDGDYLCFNIDGEVHRLKYEK